MAHQSHRREFMQASALAGLGLWVAGGVKAQESQSPNEKIRFACIGVGGKGSSDSADAGKHGDVVAICDIDVARLEGAAKKFPKAKKYFDYRQMLDEMHGEIDAVTVSTPDHSHAPASIMAMKHGLHCFCQKPLTRSLHEARRMAEVASEMNVATQMGNQGTAGAGLRRAAKVIQAGALGDVTEVHVWTNRPVWPQGGDAPEPSPQPENVKWDLWLGPAPYRPYADKLHPFNWRGWWDFGTGALGDMACHTLNMPFMALDLRNPTSVVAKTSGHNEQSYPKWSVIDYEFPANGNRGAVKMTWYDGGERPSAGLLDGEEPAESGALVVGSKGKLYSAGDYGARYKILGDVDEPEVEIVESPGHFTEFAEAIKGGPAARSNFPEYSVPLTETVLLGNLAVWADGKKIDWDAKNQQATNAPEVEHIIRPEYRHRTGYAI